MNVFLVHMLPASDQLACDINLYDGATHAVTSEINDVSCNDCKNKWLVYVNEQLAELQAQRSLEIIRLEEENGFLQAEVRRVGILNTNLQRKKNNLETVCNRLRGERDRANREIAAMRRDAQGRGFGSRL